MAIHCGSWSLQFLVMSTVKSDGPTKLKPPRTINLTTHSFSLNLLSCLPSFYAHRKRQIQNICFGQNGRSICKHPSIWKEKCEFFLTTRDFGYLDWQKFRWRLRKLKHAWWGRCERLIVRVSWRTCCLYLEDKDSELYNIILIKPPSFDFYWNQKLGGAT